MRRNQGFTLIESMVSISVALVMILAIGYLTNTMMAAIRDETSNMELEQAGQGVIASIERELSIGKLKRFTLVGGLISLDYVIPVDVGEDTNGNRVLDPLEDANQNGFLDLTDGDFTGPLGEIQWGLVDANGPKLDTPQNPIAIKIFLITESTISESAVGADINGDGDQADAFQIGSIRHSSGGQSSSFGRGRILFVDTDPFADLNGDGAADPLFELKGEPFIDEDGNGIYDHGEAFTDLNGNTDWDGRLRMSVWIFKDLDGGKFVLRNFFASWKIRDK